MREQATDRVCDALSRLKGDGAELLQHGSEVLVKHPRIGWGVLRTEGCVVVTGRREQKVSTDRTTSLDISVFSEQDGVVEWSQTRTHNGLRVFDYWLVNVGVDNPRVYVEWGL